MMRVFTEDTTVGKSSRVALWLIVANMVVAGLSFVVQNPDLYDPKWVSLANVLLVLGMNYFNPKTKNI